MTCVFALEYHVPASRRAVVFAVDAFEEGKHPRGEGGRFGHGAGGLRPHPVGKMRDYTPKELDWEHGVEYEKYSKPSFPHAFQDRADFDQKLAAAPLVHLTDEQLHKLGNSMAASGVGRSETWAHRTFGHRRDVKRIVEALKNGKTAPPIVLKSGNHLHLMAGQTRLATGAALGVHVPVKLVDVGPKAQDAAWHEELHPRDDGGKFSTGGGGGSVSSGFEGTSGGSGGSSVPSTATYIPNSHLQLALTSNGFKKVKGEAMPTFYDPVTKVKVVVLPSGKKSSTQWGIEGHPTHAGKTGFGIPDLQKLLQLAQAEGAKKVQASTPAEQPATSTGPLPQPTSAFTSVLTAKSYAAVPNPKNGHQALFQHGAGMNAKYVQVDPVSGAWVVQTPGFQTKAGTGAATLGDLLAGKKATQLPGGGYSWETTQEVIGPQAKETSKGAAATPKPKAETPEHVKLRKELATARATPTGTEQSAISEYKGSGYIGWNHALRHQPSFHDAKTEALDGWLHRSGPIPVDCVLYRTVPNDEYAKILKTVLFSGAHFADYGYGSTTTDPNFNFKPGGLKFKINVPKGTIGAVISGGSDSESEVLLARDTRYVVNSFDRKNSLVEVTVDHSHHHAKKQEMAA